MTKAMIKMLLAVFILFGAIFAWKIYSSISNKYHVFSALKSRVETVSATQTTTSTWQNSLSAVGSVRTFQGVDVTTELGGLIEEIYFQSGETVQKNQILVQLDISTDVAKLHSLEAEANLAKITYERNKKQHKIGGVSQETLDENEAQYKSSVANVEEQKATIEKKTIKAPFSGKLGISLINAGQYLNPGDPIVNLETLSPIYVNFYLPQEDISELHVGSPISLTVDAFAKQTFRGAITTINPIVDTSSRNVEIQATFMNEEQLLLPGMFVHVSLNVGKSQQFITLPQTAISFNPYGDIVYTLTKTNQTSNEKPVWSAKELFVKTGETRGNQIAVLSGVKAGEMVVTSGQVKIMNNSKVVINNSLAPSDAAKPQVKGE